MSENTLSGTSLAGMSTTRDRVENDFYATPQTAVEAILNEIPLEGSILEPAAGQGHISKVLREKYPHSEIVSTDLVQREDKFGIFVAGGWTSYITTTADGLIMSLQTHLSNWQRNLSREHWRFQAAR